MKVVLLGPPGAGKGTQGRALAHRLGIPHVATGDIIRDHIARRTEFGRAVEAQIAEGRFASDADILYWVSRRLEEADAAQGYILDGFPRAMSQAQVFAGTLDAVVWLEIDEPSRRARLVGRLTCPACGASYHEPALPPRVPGVCDEDQTCLVKRPEDGQDGRRRQIYQEVTAPLRPFYAERGLLLPISGLGEPGQVTARVLSALSAVTAGPLAIAGF